MENKKISVILNGKSIFADSGLSLSEIISGEKPCGGHGRCGKCKIIARGELSDITEAEKKLISAEELERGVRLACLVYPRGNCEIKTLSENEQTNVLTYSALDEFKLQPSFSKFGVAMDIGTTTLAARLYDVNGNMLSETAMLNPQQKWGADVISRIEAALDGKASDLTKAIREALNGMISELSKLAKIDEKQIDGVCITGNTVMLSLLTEESVEPFSHAPFDTKRLFGESLTANELQLPCLDQDTPIYLPHCISAFVGADTTCSIISSRLLEKDKAILADIGTNGEMALINNGRLTVCSTAAGPAFEGVGISMGMRGAVGAIDKVTIYNGKLCAHVIGETNPVGICGSGLVDAVACMLNLEELDESGYLEDEELTLQAPVSLTQKDIRMLQLAKSAICAGIMTLIKNEGIEQDSISSLYIAGGFGYYLNKESAAKIGLMPSDLAKKSTAIGNAALAGASMILLNTKTRDEATDIARRTTVLDLASSPVFSEYYMLGMTLNKI